MKHGATVRYEPRRGKGNVCRQMFRDIDAACYLMVDGDDTYPAEAAKGLCAPIIDKKADMVVGDRLSNGTYAKANRRAFHGLGNNLVRAMIKWIYGYEYADVMTGYRAMSKPFVKTFPVLSEASRLRPSYPYTPSTVVGASPTSRWSTATVPRLGLEAGHREGRVEGDRDDRHPFKDYRPLKFFSLVALIFCIGGLCAGMPVVTEYLATGLVPRFPTAILAAALMFTAAISLATGFILDAVAKVERKQWELRVYRQTEED